MIGKFRSLRCGSHNQHVYSINSIVISVILATCTACSDPKAVQTFAEMAPAPAMAHGLTRIYISEPGWRSRLDVATNVRPASNVTIQTTQRRKEAKGIIALDTGIREYMKALGALASDSVVQTSSNVKDLKTGLTAFQKAMPSLGLTNSDVTLVSEFVQAIGDLAETDYRNAKLSQLIGKYNQSVQRALSIQIDIVNRAIVPSIMEYNLTVASKQHFLNSQSHAMHYLFDRFLSADVENAKTQLAAARSYAKALNDIKVAQAALYKSRNDVLTKAMFEQIRGPAQEAYKAFQDYQSAIAVSAAK